LHRHRAQTLAKSRVLAGCPRWRRTRRSGDRQRRLCRRLRIPRWGGTPFGMGRYWPDGADCLTPIFRRFSCLHRHCVQTFGADICLDARRILDALFALAESC